ncbi:MAG: baseplate J/gp47 family protein [Leptolyngbyaceae cyanobacterium]
MTLIDPGRPFGRSFASLIADLEDQIRAGVEQPAEFRAIYQKKVNRYPLSSEATSVFRVSGRVNDRFTVFEPGRDYRFANNQIVWIHALSSQETLSAVEQPRHPDVGSPFEAEYTVRSRPIGLNDFSPGSVVGTLVRAFSREVKLLYDQMDEAYRRAFIDVATGFALDNVVALLGVVRNPATQAQGRVTFSRRQTTQTVQIPANTRVADERGTVFTTVETALFLAGNTTLSVPIAAVQPGPEGNIAANTITVMPTPPPGVDGVTNPEPTINGQEPESDDDLRERAKNALARSGNATLTAIEFAVRDIDTVEAVEVLDHTRDENIPVGEVRVRYSGGDAALVQQVVDQTRAAGILARLEAISEVLITGVFYVIGEPDASADAAIAYRGILLNAITALGIGESLSIRRLRAQVVNVPGLAEVAEVQLQRDPPAPGGDTSSADAFMVASNELLQADPEQLQVRLLRELQVTSTQRDGAPTIDLQIIDETGSVVRFTAFTLDVGGVLRGFLRANPTAPPERISSLAAALSFSDSDTVSLRPQVDINETFRDRYTADVEINLNAALYPGLRPATTRIVAIPMDALETYEPRRLGNAYDLDIQVLAAAEANAPLEFNNFALTVDIICRTRLSDGGQRRQQVGRITRQLRFNGSSIAPLRLTPEDLTSFDPARHDPNIDVEITAVNYPNITSVEPTLDFSFLAAEETP